MTTIANTSCRVEGGDQLRASAQGTARCSNCDAELTASDVAPVCNVCKPMFRTPSEQYQEAVERVNKSTDREIWTDNPPSPATGPAIGTGLPRAPMPEWQQRQFESLIDKLSQWRGDDHEGAIVLCRSEIIAILEGVKMCRNVGLASAPAPHTPVRSGGLEDVYRMALERVAELGLSMKPYHREGNRIGQMIEAAQAALSGTAEPARSGLETALFDLLEAVESAIDLDAQLPAFRKRVAASRAALTGGGK